MSFSLGVFIIGIPIERVHVTCTEFILGKECLLVQSFVYDIKLVGTDG